MNERFANLKKIPREPARRLMALSNARFETDLEAPAAAPVDVVLAELAEKEAHADMLRLLATALPVREAIWWGCLAAGDLLPEGAPPPAPLAAARAWVFKPTVENREKARRAAETAEPGDDTALAATAVAMYDGKLGGEGEMVKYDAPAGAAAMSVLALNAMSLGTATPERFRTRMDLLIDRALDIARGGNGQVAEADPPPPPTAPPADYFDEADETGTGSRAP